MAKKQRPAPPLEEPPTASSDSSEEDQIPSSEPHNEEEEDDDEEEASSEEEEEEEEHQPLSNSKNTPPPPSNSHPKRASSESDAESDSGSESDPPPPPTNSKVKPLPSKPTDQTPKVNSKSQLPAKDKSTSKRPAKNNNGPANDPKRAKKKGTDAVASPAPAPAPAPASSSDDEPEEDVKKSGGDGRKLFQRLWSDEDEIAILKGMVEFTSNTGSDPYRYADAFHSFMKKSLHVEASSNQLKQKIRRLKKKYENSAGRKGKNGEAPSFAKPHDREAFELSKKVWGNAAGGGGEANGGVEKAKSDGKAAKSPKKEGRTTNAAPPKPKPESKFELRSSDSKKAVKMDIDEKTDTVSYLMEVIGLDKGVCLYGLSEDVVKRGLELIGESERAELEGQWKELQHAELELSLKRAELVANQTRLILEAYKSTNH